MRENYAVPLTEKDKEIIDAVKVLEKHIPVRASLCSLVFCFVYACSDEYHQTFVPGRAGAMIDVAVDLVGVLLGLALVLLVCIACMRRKELK